MKPFYAFLSTFCGGLVLFAATAAHAQATRPSDVTIEIYGRLGALETARRFRESGKGDWVCSVYRELLWMEQNAQYSVPSAGDMASTRRLINLACN